MREVIIVPNLRPAAIESGWQSQAPQGWRCFADDAALTDVCPGCVTPVERADEVIAEAEASVYFGEGDF